MVVKCQLSGGEGEWGKRGRRGTNKTVKFIQANYPRPKKKRKNIFLGKMHQSTIDIEFKRNCIFTFSRNCERRLTQFYSFFRKQFFDKKGKC
jgi:hypothetical protein